MILRVYSDGLKQLGAFLEDGATDKQVKKLVSDDVHLECSGGNSSSPAKDLQPVGSCRYCFGFLGSCEYLCHENVLEGNYEVEVGVTFLADDFIGPLPDHILAFLGWRASSTTMLRTILQVYPVKILPCVSLGSGHCAYNHAAYSLLVRLALCVRVERDYWEAFWTTITVTLNEMLIESLTKQIAQRIGW